MKKTNEELQSLINQATAGDKKPLKHSLQGCRIWFSTYLYGCLAHLQMQRMPRRIFC